MSNFGPNPGAPRAGRPPTLPTPPTGMTIARYATYAEAQRAVDFLSDNAFPVQFVTIVGTDLRMVERVTGRLTYGRVALGGIASGAYFGLFVGLLLLIFSGSNDFSLFFAVIIGAGFGMLFGVISYAFTRGRRDFTSASQIVASEYQVLCAEHHARSAMEVLGRLASAGGPRSLTAATGPAPTQPAGEFGPPPGHPRYAPPPAAAPEPPVSAMPSGSGYGPPPGSPGYAPPVAAPPPVDTPVPSPPPVEGLTYGEVMEARRRERQELKRQEAERLDRERGEGERLERGRQEGAGLEPGEPGGIGGAGGTGAPGGAPQDGPA